MDIFVHFNKSNEWNYFLHVIEENVPQPQNKI